MREVFIDTETTGLSPDEGHRLIELAGIEVLDKKQLGATYHCYIQPQKELDPGASAVHGITNEFLFDKPTFKNMYKAFLGFVGNATIVAHSAPFDISFINKELALVGQKPIDENRKIIDTREICRNLFPGQKTNLESLIDRFGISPENKDNEGALLDAELMAEVYLQLLKRYDF